MHRHVSLLVAAGLMSITVHAQGVIPLPPTTAPQTPPPAIAPAQTPPPPPSAPRPGTRPIDDRNPANNVRVDLAITDAGGAPASKKVVTMLVADGHMGRIRSQNTVQVTESGMTFTRNIVLNIDATPTVRTDGRVLLFLTVEYAPEATQNPSKPASINESLTVLVADGKATLISQAADPATDRKVSVEVTATVIK